MVLARVAFPHRGHEGVSPQDQASHGEHPQHDQAVHPTGIRFPKRREPDPLRHAHLLKGSNPAPKSPVGSGIYLQICLKSPFLGRGLGEPCDGACRRQDALLRPLDVLSERSADLGGGGDARPRSSERCLRLLYCQVALIRAHDPHDCALRSGYGLCGLCQNHGCLGQLDFDASHAAQCRRRPLRAVDRSKEQSAMRARAALRRRAP